MTDKYIKEIRVRGFQYEANKTAWFVLPVNNEGQVLYDVLGQVRELLVGYEELDASHHQPTCLPSL